MFSEELSTLVDLLGRRDFLTALGIAAAAAIATRLTMKVPRPAGLILGATFLGLVIANPPNGVPIAGTAMLVAAAIVAIGGYLLRRSPLDPVGMGLLVAGAAIAGFAARPSGLWWVDLGCVAITVAGAVAFRLVATSLPPSSTLLMLFISFGGVWATVPDTELARVALGAITGLLLLATAPRWTPGAWGSLGAVAALLIGFMGASSASARYGSAIGAWASLSGFFVLAILFRRTQRPISTGWALAVHAVLALVASQLAGHAQSGAVALAIMVPVVLAVSAIVGAAHRAPAS